MHLNELWMQNQAPIWALKQLLRTSIFQNFKKFRGNILVLTHLTCQSELSILSSDSFE